MKQKEIRSIYIILHILYLIDYLKFDASRKTFECEHKKTC